MQRFWLFGVLLLLGVATTQAATVGAVVINEIAWMGTASSANDEWLELYNNSAADIDLTGWTLAAEDGTPSISLTGTIAAGGYFLLERTDDTTISDMAADQIYTGALDNTGEVLVLRDDLGIEIDRVDVWHAGDNNTKASMERISPVGGGIDASNWANNDSVTVSGLDADGNPLMATPRAQNSVYVVPADTTAPTDADLLSATAGDTQVALSWSAATDDTAVVSYKIYLSTDGGMSWDAGADLGDVLTLTQTGLTNGTVYDFKITALDAAANESIGIINSATPLLPDTTAPTDVGSLFVSAGDAQVALSWNAATDPSIDLGQASGVASYFLYISTDGGTSWDTGADLGSVLIFNQVGLINDQVYNFKITAKDTAGNESVGITTSATPQGIFTEAAAGEVVINEIAWAGSSSSSSDEWLELRNTSATKTFDLTNWVLTRAATSGGDLTLAAGMLTPGSYFLISNNSESHSFSGGESVLNIAPDITDSAVSLSNSALQIGLKDLAGSIVDTAGSGGAPLAGDSTSFTTMARKAGTDGTLAESWVMAGRAVSLDEGAIDLATPRATNFLDHDLAVMSFTASSLNPLPGEAVTLTATISNAGLSTEASFAVEFYLGNPDVGGILLGSETISNLASFESQTVTQVWMATTGSFSFFARTVLAADEFTANNSANFALTTAEHLVISEFTPDPAGADATGEWIEIYNPMTVAVDLSGWTLNGTTLTTVSLSPGGYAYILAGDATADGTRLAWTESWSTLANSSGVLELRDASSNLIDSASYSTATEGKSFGRDNADLTNWTEYWHPTPGNANIELNQNPTAVITIQGSGNSSGSCSLYANLTGENSSDPDGDALTYDWQFGNGEVSTEANPSGFYYSTGTFTATLTVMDVIGATSSASQVFSATSCSGSGSDISVNTVIPIYSGAIKINEFLPDPSGDDATQEWIELINLGNTSVDLTDWQLDDEVGRGSRPYKLPSGINLPANGFLLISSSDSHIALNNTGDTVRLLDPAGQEKDSVMYGRALSGQSYARDADGYFSWAANPTPAEPNLLSADLLDHTELRSATARDVRLHSVLPNPVGSDRDQEWFKIQNLAADPINLQGLTIASGKKSFTFTEITPVAPGQVKIFYAHELGLTLRNGQDELRLSDAQGSLMDRLAWQEIAEGGVFLHRFMGESQVSDILVLRAVDGDTIEVLMDGEKKKIRLIGVNTLEKDDQVAAHRELAFAATVFTHQHLKNQKVRLEYDWQIFDHYGRILAYVYLPDGALFNEMLIRQGYSEPYLKYEFRLKEHFAQLASIIHDKSQPPLDPLAILDALDPIELEQLKIELESEAEEITPISDPAVVINELLPNPIGSDTAAEWIELKNISADPIDLLDWKLDDAVGGSKPYAFLESTILNPQELLLLPRQQTKIALNNASDEVRLFSPVGVLTDLVSYADIREGQVYARTDAGSWHLSDLSTPGQPNAFFRILPADEDADGDGLTDAEEIELKTDPTLFDTDGDRLPDLFEVRHGLDPVAAADATLEILKIYRDELTQFASVSLQRLASETEGVFLAGHGIPGGNVRIYIQSELKIITVPVNVDGAWSYVLDQPLEAGRHNIFTQILDPDGFESTAIKVLAFDFLHGFTPPTFAESVVISEVLPNPVGNDAAGEWIELANFGAESADLTNFKISSGSRSFELPMDTVLAAGEFLLLSRAETGLVLKNSNGQVSLAWPTGRIVSQATWEKVSEGNSIAGQLDNKQQLVFFETQIPTPGAMNEIIAPKSRAKKGIPIYHNGNLSSQIIISEVLANPVGSDTAGEWIELQNFGSQAVNLGNWQLADRQKSFRISDNVSLAPGDFRIFLRPETKLSLNNSGIEIVQLFDFRGQLISAVEFSDPAEGASLALEMQNEECKMQNNCFVNSDNYRFTQILTPGASNEFDTIRLAGRVHFVGVDGFVLDTESGEVWIAFVDAPSSRLARAVLGRRENWQIFARETTTGFELASFTLPTDLSTVQQIIFVPQKNWSDWLLAAMFLLILAFFALLRWGKLTVLKNKIWILE